MLLTENSALHTMLKEKKHCINDVSNWKVRKRLTNPYELLSDILTHKSPPVSRAYFKIWEILSEDVLGVGSIMSNAKPLQIATLAEAPGGFIEGIVRYRNTHRPQWDPDADVIHAITLCNPHAPPKWRIGRLIANEKKHRCRIALHRGVDGTGDICRLENIDAFAEACAASASRGVDLVTADGGFDIGGRYDQQEEISTRLIACEVYAAMRIQAVGGAFVLKIFDICHPSTFAILTLLRRLYSTVHLVKPLSSRPANSEKYVVATGFCRLPRASAERQAQLLSEAQDALRACLDVRGDEEFMAAVASGFFCGEERPCLRLVEDVLKFNRSNIARQIEVLDLTINDWSTASKACDQVRNAQTWYRVNKHDL